LLTYALPLSTGNGGIVSNFPATIQNAGLELTINTVNVKNKSFNWTSALNFTLGKNKLVAFPNLQTSSYANDLTVGKSINALRYYKFAGVNENTGLYQFIDRDGKTTSDPLFDPANRTQIINTDPSYYGGLQNAFSYKGFEVSVLVQFVKQKGKTNRFTSVAGQLLNQPVTLLNRWQNIGDDKSFQKYAVGITSFDYSMPNFYASLSDAAFGDASYIRLKNVSISWEFPKRWINDVKLTNARLFIQGQNVLTATSYVGLDPETRSSGTLPPLRILTLGLQVGL
jgi:TonB-dependent starch-binding outer membrane protein SusC